MVFPVKCNWYLYSKWPYHCCVTMYSVHVYMPLFGETEPVIGFTHYSYAHNYTCIVPIHCGEF